MAFGVNYLVVAGGGAGPDSGGGGGAGGYKEVTDYSFQIAPGAYFITVGAGGVRGSGSNSTNGGDSIFSTITATGGGKGGQNATLPSTGGSGGGGGVFNGSVKAGAAGTVGQGSAGGNSYNPDRAGGGGGASAVGDAGTVAAAGNGGAGTASSITGSSVTYAGGGGGGAWTGFTGGTGGSGGGGNGGVNSGTAATAGTANTGGGGGGGGGTGANGGSGIVVLRYLTSDLSGYTVTGGTTTTDGSYTVRTWTADGTLRIVASSPTFNINYLVVGGGGGGGSGAAAGGGAGGYLEGTGYAYPMSAGSYAVTVGAGGNGGATSSQANGSAGGNSIFEDIRAIGGGYGAGGTGAAGGTGGSGGGGRWSGGAGGAKTTGQGNNGGAGSSAATYYGEGGGGGASAAGAAGTAIAGGDGGAGTASSISGASVTYAGGGGGAAESVGTAGVGGAGGGGAGNNNSGAGTNGTANTGGGGGGGSGHSPNAAGGNGGSGVVILRYLTSDASGFTVTGGTKTTDGSYTVHTFTSSGTFSVGENRYWVGGAGTWDTSSTTVWSTSSGGASGASVPTATNSVFFDVGSGVPGTVTLTGALTCLDITVSLIGWTFASTGTIDISGNMSLTALTTWTGTGTLTFNATTSKTITTSGTSFSCPMTFNGVAGTWTLQDALTLGSTRALTLTAGTFNANTYNVTTGILNIGGTSTRTLAFGSGAWSITGNNTTVYNGDYQTGLTVTGTKKLSFTYSGAVGSRKIDSRDSTEANAIDIYVTAGTDTFARANEILVIGGLVMTGFTGTLNFGTSSGNPKTFYGDFILDGGMVASPSLDSRQTYISKSSGTVSINTNGIVPVLGTNQGGLYLTGAATKQLTGNSSFDGAVVTTFDQGTLDLQSFTLTVYAFTSNSGTRTIAFGTGKIAVTGNNATVLSLSPTSLTTSGTIKFESTYTGAVGTRTFALGAFTEAASFDVLAATGSAGLSIGTSGTDIVSITGACKNLTFTGFTGTWTTGALTTYGNLTVASGMTVGASASTLTFGATSSKTITTNAVTLDFPTTFNGVAGTWTLQDALTVGSTRTTTLTAGTLGLSSYTLSTGLFNSNNATTRIIAFGTGNITATNASATAIDISNGTNLTTTGTPIFVTTNATTAGLSLGTTAGYWTEANSLPVSIGASAGSAGIYITNTAALTLAGVYGNVILTGFTGTLANSIRTIYGNLNAASGGTYTAGTNATTFAATASKTITTNGKTLDFPVTFNGVAGTWTLQDALTGGATRTVTLTAGTLGLSSYTLTTGLFASSGSTARTLAFGTGNITLSAATAVTMWNTATVTNLTISGTPIVNATGGGAVTKTINSGALAEANAVSFNLQCSAGTVAFTAANTIKNLTLNGAFTLSNIAITIYGNYTYTASTTLTAGTNAWTFASTSSQTINSGATTLDFPITFNGAAGTWALGAGLTVGSTRLTTLTNGTLSLAGFTYSTGTFSTATGTKNITFNAGTFTVTGSGATAFNNAQPTNFTTTAGTGTGYISMSSATAKTFVGGGSTFNATLSQDGAGALTITGSNTFANIRNTTQPVTVSFTAGTTTTFTSGFSLSGTAGNLVTIGSVTAASHTLSKASGTVNVSYCTISRSSATGGASWQAYTSNGNVDGGNNTGWIFAAVSAATGNFFAVF